MKMMALTRALFIAGFALVCYHPRFIDRLLIEPFIEPRAAESAVLITGTSSGLGRHASLYLASRGGFTVIATVRKETDVISLKRAWEKERERKHGMEIGDVVPIIMDVTSEESVSTAKYVVEKILKERGLDLVAIINNAGVNAHGSILSEAGSPSSYEWNFGVNVFGVVRVTQEFLPAINRSKNGGRVLIVGSVAGVLAAEKGAPYTATKHSLEGMADAWRRELYNDKISVSLIQPGFIASKMCSREICDDSYLPDFSSAVLHATRDPYPQTRYAVANVVVMPAWLAVWIDSTLPDRVSDWIVSVVVKNTGISADVDNVGE